MQLKGFTTPVIFAILLSLFFVGQPAWAGRVVKVKGKKVYIILDQEEVDSSANGDHLYVTTTSGKKRGIVTIRKMKGNKVIAQLRKGKASKSMLTQPRKAAANKKQRRRRQDKQEMERASEVAEVENTTETTEFPEMMFGILGTYGMASQSVSGIADMTGSLMGAKLAFDYELFSNVGVKARLGMDMLSVTGSMGSNSYKTGINYITLDFLLRYYIMRSKSFGLFANGGFGIYSPMSTDLGPSGSQALQQDSISTTSVGIFGLGISIPISSMELQLGADYFYFPTSADVNTSVIGGKLGLYFPL